jgi:hypothetical protein
LPLFLEVFAIEVHRIVDILATFGGTLAATARSIDEFQANMVAATDRIAKSYPLEGPTKFINLLGRVLSMQSPHPVSHCRCRVVNPQVIRLLHLRFIEAPRRLLLKSNSNLHSTVVIRYRRIHRRELSLETGRLKEKCHPFIGMSNQCFREINTPMAEISHRSTKELRISLLFPRARPT